MIMAMYVILAAGVAIAAWALLPQPSVSLPGTIRASAGGSMEYLSGGGLAMPRGLSGRGVAGALASLGRHLPRLGRPIEETGESFIYSGVNLTVDQVGGIKLLAALGAALVAFTVAREFQGVEPLVAALVASVVGWMLPDLRLKARVRARQRVIVRLLPEVIDLLSLCIGAGLDFLGALNKVMVVKAFRKEPLIEELSIVLQEIKLGKRRFEALKGMAKRVSVPEISSFVRTLVQADRMGTPIAEVLSIHSEDIRFQRFTRAERAALKAPIKILIPLIFCIMPCVALIVGAPIFLQFLRQTPFGK